MWDQHMHCIFSGDSEALPSDMINSAITKGLDGICFTDHLDYDYKEEPGLFDLDLDGYREKISECKDKFLHSHPDFKIHWGIEIGLQPHITDKNNNVTSKYPFDLVIGSSHVVNGTDPYYPDFYKNRSEDAAYTEYFESILDNLHTNTDFDVYGHIDYVVRYGPNKNKFYSYDKYSDVIDEILRSIIDKGRGIELNTAGFKYGLGHPNPTEEILKRYHSLGGEIITVGADAHKPGHVAYDFDKVPDILKDAGFKYYTVFENRIPHFLKIDWHRTKQNSSKIFSHK